MSLQIGRIGLATASGGDGYTLDDPSTIVQNGRTLRLEGVQSGTTDGLLWLRDQFLGLVDDGAEPVIPVTFSTLSSLDGYYRINAAQADHPRGGLGASGSGNWAFWSVDLERIRDWRNPKVEISTFAGVVTNSHSVTSGDMLVGNPGGTEAYYHGYPLGMGVTTVSNGDGFTQSYWYQTEPAATLATTTPFTQHLYVPAASWYKGGCRVEFNVASGGTYYEVTGHRPFPSADIIGRVRMSNGLVRVLPNTVGGVATYWWDGSAWDGPYRWDQVHGSLIVWNSAAVLRNTPEECAIRLASNVSGATLGPVYCDLSIRRGSRNVIGYLIGGGYQGSFQFSVTPNATYGGTTFTGGVRKTSNDTYGNRTFLVSDNGTTISAVNGSVAQASAGSPMLFGIGCEIGGSGSSGGDVVSAQAAQFWAAMSESQIVTAL